MTTLPSFCQPELNLRLKAARGVNRDSVAELCGLLRGRGWVTARALQALRPEWTERFIRALAKWSEGRVISGPGMPGYCLSEEVSDADLRRAANTLISQGKEMEERGIVYRHLLALREAARKLVGGK